jgi:hypothetical protein
MNLQTCKLSQLSALRSEYSLGLLTHGHTVLVVHFFGEIENNRATDDYAFASAMLMAGLEAWQPWALVIDFTRTFYSWGDHMENVLLASQRWAEPVLRSRSIFLGDSLPDRFPTAVVVSDSNREGLTGLVQSHLGTEPSSFLFDTIESALDALGAQLARTPLL